MALSESDLTTYLLTRMREVLEGFSANGTGPLTPTTRFADAFDSMAMVEFLGMVAEDCGCSVAAIEQCVRRRFTIVEDLAHAMQAAGLVPSQQIEPAPSAASASTVAASHHVSTTELGLASQRAAEPGPLAETGPVGAALPATRAIWLAGLAVRLPRQVQSAAELDRAVGRPTGWLERRAGILQRRVWDSEDPLEAASECAVQALGKAGVPPEQLGALVTVSEAPPLAVGLAAAIHHRIGLRPQVPCFELGGACTGFLSAVALGGALVQRAGPIVIVSVEAHSRLLPLSPGPQGESAALFGDGSVAVVLAGEPAMPGSAKLIDLRTFVDGSAADLIRVQQSEGGSFCLDMEGVPLAEYALHAMSSATRELASHHKLPLSKLAAVVAHGGNGRMPAMLARQLHLPLSKVWSDVSHTGNLGSASVPVAWASRAHAVRGPVIWTAVGAGLQWGAALWEV